MKKALLIKAGIISVGIILCGRLIGVSLASGNESQGEVVVEVDSVEVTLPIGSNDETAQVKVVVEKYSPGSMSLRYDKIKGVWIPYTPHILVLNKKKVFGVPILNDVKKWKVK